MQKDYSIKCMNLLPRQILIILFRRLTVIIIKPSDGAVV